MPPLYVLQQNARLHLRNARLEVEYSEDADAPADVLASLPLGQVEQVVLFGNVSLTTPAIGALLDGNVDVVFCTADGRYRGRLVGSFTPHVPMRRAQYLRLEQPDFVLQMARSFTHAKLEHQRALLLRHNREHGDPSLASAAQQIAAALEQVERKTTLTSLRGLEGSATAAYFGGYRRLFGAEWNFNRRNRRPPADAVNVLLSFGYTLLAQAAAGAVQAVGLDPYFGFLHEVVYNRPALGLDLMEEFRPVVDGVVLWACRGGQVTPADFQPGPAERPVVLSDAGRKRFVQAYEQRMQQLFTHPLRGARLPLRQCLIEQARQVAACIQNERPDFRGMGFR